MFCQKYGATSKCAGGKGGRWANDVYIMQDYCPEFSRSVKGKWCGYNKQNVLKAFIPPSSSISDAIKSRDECEEFCCKEPACWGCSIHCGSPCQFNAIPECGPLKTWSGGVIEGDVTQKPSMEDAMTKIGGDSVKEVEKITDCSCNGIIDDNSEGECLSTWNGVMWCYVDQDSGCNDTKLWSGNIGYQLNYSFQACQHINPYPGKVKKGNQFPQISEVKVNASGHENMKIIESKVHATGYKDIKTKNAFLTYIQKHFPMVCLVTFGIAIFPAIIILLLLCGRANAMKKIEQYVELLLKGDKNSINSDRPINEQIELLEYDKKHEVDYGNITFNDQIGNGQFGKVFIGTAKGIFDEKDTKVAIKQVKNTSDKQHLESIIGELKIMSNMGNHVNLVNFIGATTSNVATKKINILLEYCIYGDLKKFLQDNYEQFISHLQTENKTDNIHTPKILFKWCHEIAKGMEYLEGEKIMHGDLAARNVLLDEDYVAKISDFGLAKHLYYTNATYKKMDRRMIPWAWMGIEYLRTGEFTLKSDVWSYGILLWEIYSLGAKPYGIESFLDVKNKLESGWRLPAPDHMSELDEGREVYSSIMEKCWKSSQSQRPSFNQLVEELENMMGREEMDNYQENVEKFYKKMAKMHRRSHTI